LLAKKARERRFYVNPLVAVLALAASAWGYGCAFGPKLTKEEGEGGKPEPKGDGTYIKTRDARFYAHWHKCGVGNGATCKKLALDQMLTAGMFLCFATVFLALRAM
jgi:hypothetical protein